MTKEKINLGKYDLNKVLRNPAEIHLIQDALTGLKGEDFLSHAIRQGAAKDIDSCLKMIVEQYRDNPKVMIEIVGKKTLQDIEDFLGITLASDIPDELFTQTLN